MELPEPQRRSFPTLEINKKEYEFLQVMNKSLDYGKKVRLLWSPAPSRTNPSVVPTKVTLVAEEDCFANYLIYELNKERNQVSPVTEMRQAARAEVTV